MPETIWWEDLYLTEEIERNFFNEDEDDDFIRDLTEELWEEDDYE